MQRLGRWFCSLPLVIAVATYLLLYFLPTRYAWTDARRILLSLFTFAIAFGAATRQLSQKSSPAAKAPAALRPRLGSTLLVAALALLACLFARIHFGHQSWSELGLWFAVFALFLASLASPAKSFLLSTEYGERWMIALFFIFYLYLVGHDADSWLYSAIGDELGFYGWAKNVCTGKYHAFFNQLGPDNFAVLASVFQAIFMKATDCRAFGWRFASAVDATVAAVGLYFLARQLFSRPVAILSTIFFASSQFILAFAHNGKFMLHPIPFVAWGMTLFVVADQNKQNPRWLGASGLIFGVGTYAPPVGLIWLPLLATYLCIKQKFSYRALLRYWPLLAGFVLAIAPLAYTSGSTLLTVFWHDSVYSNDLGGHHPDRIAYAIAITKWVFCMPGLNTHFVLGGFLPPASGTLVVLGLGVLMRNLRQPAFYLLGIWSFGLFVGIILLSPYADLPVNRMPSFLLPFSMLAALATIEIAVATGTLFNQRGMQHALLGICVALAVLENGYLFFVKFPRIGNVPSVAKTLGILQTGICPMDEHTRIYSLDPNAFAIKLLDAYLGFPRERIAPADTLSALKEMPKEITCAVFEDPWEPLPDSAVKRWKIAEPLLKGDLWPPLAPLPVYYLKRGE